MAVGGVGGEPVSWSDSRIGREETGNFSETGPPGGVWSDIADPFRVLENSLLAMNFPLVVRHLDLLGHDPWRSWQDVRLDL